MMVTKSFDVLLFQVLQLVVGNIFYCQQAAAQAEEANKHKVGGKIPSRPGYGNLFSCRVLFGLFFKVPALSSDSEGAVVRIHSSYAVPSSTNYCHYNILPMACTLKADSSDIYI